MKKILLCCLAIFGMQSLKADFFAPWQCGSFEVGGDWLYWKPSIDNISVGLVETFSFIDDDVFATDASTSFNFPFDYSNGFRVFANYYFNDNPWSIGLAYTQHHAGQDQIFSSAIPEDDDTTSTFLAFNILNYPIVGGAFVTSPSFFFLNTSWIQHFQYLDLDIARSFLFSDRFDIGPHLGLRGLQLREAVTLSGFFPDSEVGSLGTTAAFYQKFEGFGIQGGLNASWQIGYGFALAGSLNGALLYGKTSVQESAYNGFVSGGPAVEYTTFNYDTRHISPEFSSFIGVEYQVQLWNFGVNLHAGWEQHLLMNVRLFNPNLSSNLSLQGLTLGGSIVF